MALEASVNRIAPDTAVVTLTGTLTLGPALKSVDRKVKALISDGARKLVLDVTAVPYMDSGGLGMLVQAYGLVHGEGGSVRLCGVQERVAGVIRTTHTGEYLPAFADVNAALASLA